jgi:hypothetical protein
MSLEMDFVFACSPEDAICEVVPIKSRVITINVGGLVYTTYLATLTRFQDTMIATMFAGKHTMCFDEKGNYFVDRDGELFRHILNFLRNPEEFEPPKLSPELFRNLQSEARYFGLLGHMFPYKPRKCVVSIGSIKRPNLIYSEKKVDNSHWVRWAQASIVVSRDDCGIFRASGCAESGQLRFHMLSLTYCPTCCRMYGIVSPEQHSIVTIALPENEENVDDRRLLLHFPSSRINYYDPVHAKTAEHLRPEFRVFRDQCGECFECDD